MRLGEFELVRRLGSGGMGEVFLARRGGAHVVLKLPLPHLAREPSVVESLSREAEVLSRLRHVCIPRFIERGDVAGTPYICTEYVPGVSLAFLLTKHRLSLGASLRILADVAQALTHAHLARTTDGRSLSLVHRDVSPSNMIVGFDGITRLIDFGIAKTAVSLVTTAGVARGKPRYMSPEQITSEPLDARSDIFSAGVVLYELLTHEPPFDASSEFHLMDAILHHEPALPSARGGPPDLDAVIMRALSKRREDRFQTAAEFERELLKRLASLNRGNDHHAVRAFAEAWRRDPLPTPQANPTKRPAMVETKRIEKPDAREKPQLHDILYVEDEDINWEIAERSLRHKFTLTRAKDSAEAFALLKTHHFKIILMDIQLSGSDLNGIQITEVLRGRFKGTLPAYAKGVERRETPVVFVTAYSARYPRELLKAMGGSDLVTKPVNFIDLSLVMSRLIGASAASFAPQSASL
ncbi:MAG: protein kinase [Deltaproteobacteria bacterium]|nr:protein kinase [Deltaproteobacteria bacterium]